MQKSQLRRVFDDLTWESKELKNPSPQDIFDAYAVFDEKCWKNAKKKLARMKEYTPNGTWDFVLLGEYNAIETLVIYKVF